MCVRVFVCVLSNGGPCISNYIYIYIYIYSVVHKYVHISFLKKILSYLKLRPGGQSALSQMKNRLIKDQD